MVLSLSITEDAIGLSSKCKRSTTEDKLKARPGHGTVPEIRWSTLFIIKLPLQIYFSYENVSVIQKFSLSTAYIDRGRAYLYRIFYNFYYKKISYKSPCNVQYCSAMTVEIRPAMVTWV